MADKTVIGCIPPRDAGGEPRSGARGPRDDDGELLAELLDGEGHF